MLGKTSGTNIIKLLFYIVLLLLAMKFILILSVNFVLFVHSKPFKFQRFGHRTYWLIVVFLPFSFKGHTVIPDKQNKLLCWNKNSNYCDLLPLLLFLEYFFPFISSWSWSLLLLSLLLLLLLLLSLFTVVFLFSGLFISIAMIKSLLFRENS